MLEYTIAIHTVRMIFFIFVFFIIDRSKIYLLLHETIGPN